MFNVVALVLVNFSSRTSKAFLDVVLDVIGDVDDAEYHNDGDYDDQNTVGPVDVFFIVDQD